MYKMIIVKSIIIFLYKLIKLILQNKKSPACTAELILIFTCNFDICLHTELPTRDNIFVLYREINLVCKHIKISNLICLSATKRYIFNVSTTKRYISANRNLLISYFCSLFNYTVLEHTRFLAVGIVR